MFLLGVYTLMLCQNPKKTLRFINFLSKYYRTDEQFDQTSQYNFFIKTIAADAYYNMGDAALTTKTYYSISDSYKRSENLLTPYMKTLFYSTKIKALLGSERESSIPTEIKAFNVMAEQSCSKLSKMYIYDLVLKSESLKKSFPEFYREIKYSLNRIHHEAGLNIEKPAPVFNI